jgi:diacylglycerol O-acyltransferase
MPTGEGVDPRFDERMTDLEALMWGLERADPSLQSVMVLAGVLDRPVESARMLERLEALAAAVPRLCEVPEEGPLPMVPPRWVRRPGFCVADHLRTETVGGGAGFRGLAQVVERAMSDPFERGRPPWDFALVDGIDGGGGGFVARLHHSYTDGLGAVQIALGLFDAPEDEPPAPRPAPPLAAPPTATTPLESLLWDVAHEVTTGIGALRRLAPWAAGAVREAIENPAAAAARSSEMASSLARTARAALLPGSPLLAARSGTTHVASVHLSLDDFRAAGKNHGGTVNDVFLAGLVGGISLYHDKLGSSFPAVKLGIPVSTRGGGDNSLHNQLQGTLVRAPLNLADPAERVRLLHAMVVETRRQPWLPLVDTGAAAALRLPRVTNALAGAIRCTEVLASNLPGPPDTLSLAGSRVLSLVPFGPRAGAALNLTLLSYAGEVAIGVNADSGAISDLGLLVDCLDTGFGEVLA